MGEVMAGFRGRVDGARVQTLLADALRAEPLEVAS
jgi:hypothetical protein